MVRNPYSDPEPQHTPIPNLIVENSTSYERSVVRGRKSTLDHAERQLQPSEDMAAQGHHAEEGKAAATFGERS